jgi:iron complex transport system substrate-binding protein
LPAAGGFVPLEKLIDMRPDYLVVSEALSIAEDQGQALLLHPAITRLYPLEKRLIIPDVLSICAGASTPALIDRVRLEIEAKVIRK